MFWQAWYSFSQLHKLQNKLWEILKILSEISSWNYCSVKILQKIIWKILSFLWCAHAITYYLWIKHNIFCHFAFNAYFRRLLSFLEYYLDIYLHTWTLLNMDNLWMSIFPGLRVYLLAHCASNPHPRPKPFCNGVLPSPVPPLPLSIDFK